MVQTQGNKARLYYPRQRVPSLDESMGFGKTLDTCINGVQPWTLLKSTGRQKPKLNNQIIFALACAVSTIWQAHDLGECHVVSERGRGPSECIHGFSRRASRSKGGAPWRYQQTKRSPPPHTLTSSVAALSCSALQTLIVHFFSWRSEHFALSRGRLGQPFCHI